MFIDQKIWALLGVFASTAALASSPARLADYHLHIVEGIPEVELVNRTAQMIHCDGKLKLVNPAMVARANRGSKPTLAPLATWESDDFQSVPFSMEVPASLSRLSVVDLPKGMQISDSSENDITDFQCAEGPGPVSPSSGNGAGSAKESFDDVLTSLFSDVLSDLSPATPQAGAPDDTGQIDPREVASLLEQLLGDDVTQGKTGMIYREDANTITFSLNAQTMIKVAQGLKEMGLNLAPNFSDVCQKFKEVRLTYLKQDRRMLLSAQVSVAQYFQLMNPKLAGSFDVNQVGLPQDLEYSCDLKNQHLTCAAVGDLKQHGMSLDTKGVAGILRLRSLDFDLSHADNINGKVNLGLAGNHLTFVEKAQAVTDNNSPIGYDVSANPDVGNTIKKNALFFFLPLVLLFGV